MENFVFTSGTGGSGGNWLKCFYKKCTKNCAEFFCNIWGPYLVDAHWYFRKSFKRRYISYPGKFILVLFLILEFSTSQGTVLPHSYIFISREAWKSRFYFSGRYQYVSDEPNPRCLHGTSYFVLCLFLRDLSLISELSPKSFQKHSGKNKPLLSRLHKYKFLS